MPVINGIEFWISDDFIKSTSAPNSPSTPWIVNGNDYSDLYTIVSTLNDLFSQTSVSNYLDGLPPKVYITKDDYKVSGWLGNAAWLPNSAVTISASTEFYSDLPKVTYVDPDGSGPAGPVEQVDNGIKAPLNTAGSRGHIDIAPDVLSNPSQVFKFNKIDGSDEWADFRRVLFHELAHGQTRVVNTTNWRVGSSDFIVPEALAIDAENLVYRRAFGGAVRVGHIDVFSSSSNDPTASFKNADGISFSKGAYGSGSNEAAIIRQEVGNDAIEKIYGEAAFSISTDSTYAVGNYILIKATDGDGGTDGILTAGGVPTDLLSTVLNGIAHDSIISSSILSDMGDQIDGLNDLGDELKTTLHPSLYRLQEFADLFSNVKYNEVSTAIGFSAERSLSDSDWTGPYEGTSTAKELFIEAVDGPSLLIGASGTNKGNVNFDNRTDYLRGSDSNDVLIAGTGSRSGKYNVLEGKAGEDILVGRSKDDKLLGGEGNDVLFLSLGDDIVDGGPAGSASDTDTVIVDDGLGSITIDLKVKEDGGSAVSFGGAKSIIKNIDVYVGNASKTTFKGNAEGTVFISGSGGADFYLLAGDQGIGRTGAQDNFYLDATVPAEFASWTTAQKISYLETNKVYVGNFGPEDKIFIKKNGTYILFNGNKVTTALWGETVGSDRNLDAPINAYVLTGDSSYGTAYAAPTFDVRGASWGGTPWGALSYADMQYRDVSYTATSESGLGIINFFSRGITGVEEGGSSIGAGQTGYSFNSLAENDEQLMVVIDGFQNGLGGITFENDGLANFRPGVPDSDGDDEYPPLTQNLGAAWGQEPVAGVWDYEDIFDGNVDGLMAPGGPSVTANDPRFNLGELAFGGNSVDWDAFLSGPQNIEGAGDADFLEGGWSNDQISGGDGDDYIVGGPGDDVLDGGAGNDEIHGGAGNDTLIGGIGNDQLFGDTGRNTIDGGDGDDTAYLEGPMSNFRIYRKLDGTVIAEYLYEAGNVQTFTNVETLTFSDGSLEPDDLPMGTAGDDILVGSSRSDVLDGGTGDDELAGGDGDDIYIVDAAGDLVTENMDEGTDTVRTSLTSYALGDNVEKLVFTGSGAFNGTGNDLDNEIVSGAGDDNLIGGAGYDRFVGRSGADTIDGGDDEDVVMLSGKPEDYSYSVDGLGVVTISDGINSVELTNVEYVEFAGGTGYEMSELLSRFVIGTAGNDVLLEGDGTGNVIRGLGGDDNLRGGGGSDLLDGGDGEDTAHYAGSSDDYIVYRSPSAGLTVSDQVGSDGTDFLSNIEALRFDGDNVTIDVSTIAPLGTSGNDTIVGSSRRDRLYGLAGHDSLAGANGADLLDGGVGDDTLDGGAGNDSLYGGAGNDINIFGTGNDIAWDVSGDDSYIYAAGDGADRIRDDGGTDAIILGSAITPGDVTFSVDDEDIILHFASGGSLTLLSGLAEGREIEEIRFDDSTVWNPIVRLQTPTSGNDTLIGTISADTFSAGAGNDTIEGRQGNDTLAGDTGNDVLSGGAGDDSYLFALGDGVDLIQDASSNYNYGNDGNDTLIFGVGISPIDIQVSMANGSDLVLTITGTSDQVTLKNSALRATDSIETVQFADTTVWTHADLMSRALVSTSGDDSLYGSFAAETISGDAGNDYINAREGDDVLTGGTGNDNITGGAGNDTYYFNLGDGQDNIHDYTTAVSTSLDVIVFGTGILPADIVVKQTDNGRDLVLSITGTSDKTTINDAAFVDGYRIEEVRFADSTVWTHNDLMAKAYSPKSTGDTYWGTSGADTISGGAGNDLIIASGGNDTLAGGTGNDKLYGDAGTDTVLLMGLRPTYSMLTSGGFLKVTDNAPTVDDNDGTDDLRGVEKLRFSDNEEVGIVSPIILDLDGRGVTTVSAYVGRARYDMDGDGIADLTSWIGRGEGVLFLDRDGNGTLSNAGEFSFVSDIEGAASDLVGLRAFDSNGDGTLSSGDSRFADFRIWRDRNGNGSVQDGEIVTLGEAGVAALNLNGQAVSGNTAIGDVAVLNTGSYTRTDGREMQFIDAALTYFSGASQSAGSSPPRQRVGPSSHRQLDALDRDELRGGRHRPLQVDRQYERDPIAHWPQLGDQRMWSGPAIMALDDLGHFSSPLHSAASPASGVDRQLAMMVQEMSVFGARSAGEGLGSWQRENTRPIEFFA